MTLIDRILRSAREAGDEGRRQAQRLRDQVAPRPSPWRSVALASGGALVGALAAYLLDPTRGRSRRARLADQAAAIVRHGARASARAGRIVASTSQGKLEALRRAGDAERYAMNDAELAHAIETEIFRDPRVDKGRININVERGIVVLRGEVASARERTELGRRVERIAGVWSVKNLLHQPGQPVPAEEELVGS
jgi:hypothetical protein